MFMHVTLCFCVLKFDLWSVGIRPSSIKACITKPFCTSVLPVKLIIKVQLSIYPGEKVLILL